MWFLRILTIIALDVVMGWGFVKGLHEAPTADEQFFTPVLNAVQHFTSTLSADLMDSDIFPDSWSDEAVARTSIAMTVALTICAAVFYIPYYCGELCGWLFAKAFGVALTAITGKRSAEED